MKWIGNTSSGWVVVVLSIWTSAVASAPLAAQTALSTDGNIQTDSQLVSNAATGTSPLQVSSTTLVSNLNADQVDGLEAAAFALETDLQTVEALLMALQIQVDALGLALVPRTGQTTCYDAAGAVITCGAGIGLAQDGDLQLGVVWPNPRFTNNGDGTVTDNLTGLIWLENANCANATMDWASALAFANTLFDGSVGHNGGDCGLSDGSAQGAWRLPNVLELQSLVHYGVVSPAVPNTAGTGKWVENDPFSGVQSSLYWSSTTLADDATFAWLPNLFNGVVDGGEKINTLYVWPVRGGQ